MSEKIEEQNLLIFRSGERYFSLPADMVDEIAPCSTITPLPFLEKYVDGLVSLNGQVAVQISFAVFVGDGDPESGQKDGELLQINNDTGLYALKVDEVCENLYMESNAIRHFNKEVIQDGSEPSGESQGNLIDGEFDWQGRIVMHIASNPLSEILNVVNVPGGKRASLPKRKQAKEKAEDLFRYLILALDDEQFAFPLEQVLEIYEARQITTLPGVSDNILGITVIRGEAALVLSAEVLLGLETGRGETTERLLILFEYEGARLALAFDSVIGIEDIAKDQLKLNGSNKKRGVLLSSNGILVNLLDFQLLINDSLRNELTLHMPETSQTNENIGEIETRMFLQVRSLGEKYIIPCEEVTRILDFTEPENLDKKIQGDEHKAIKGVTHFDGEVLPVLGLSDNTQYSTDNFSAYIVLKGKQYDFAIPVGEAERIVELETRNIELYTADEADVVCGLAKHEGGLLSLLDVFSLESAHLGVSPS